MKDVLEKNSELRPFADSGSSDPECVKQGSCQLKLDMKILKTMVKVLGKTFTDIENIVDI